MSDYKAESEAERAKTARLKELRLAKEAAEKTAKVTKTKKPPKAPISGHSATKVEASLQECNCTIISRRTIAWV